MFSNLLVGVDGLPGGRDAVALVKQLAAPEARFTLAYVHGGNGTSATTTMTNQTTKPSADP